jgi:1,4-alpha-glucan branching enzyme
MKYKYAITTSSGNVLLKSDPYAFRAEVRPATASVVDKLNYAWQDAKWQESRKNYDSYHNPMAIYEVHLGTWRKNKNQSLSYREIAPLLVEYVKKQHYTHIEVLPCVNILLMVPGVIRLQVILQLPAVMAVLRISCI